VKCEHDKVEQQTDNSCDLQEQPKLDIDEDRQNPAYIPKRGAFYEHDLRLDPDDVGKEGGDQQREERRYIVNAFVAFLLIVVLAWIQVADIFLGDQFCPLQKKNHQKYMYALISHNTYIHV
jgi:hypothetical protein